MLSTVLNTVFYALLGINVISAMLTGSTLQWVWLNGGFSGSQYNLIVTVAAIASLIQTVTCYVNALMAPDNNLYFMIYILVNWVIMTHFSVMLVSKKLSLTFIKSEQEKIWRRLLLINAFMLPISIFVCVYWATAHNFDNEKLTKANKIMEPVQIALWGVIEFCLSGAFIVQMWKYKWSDVERKAIYVLVLVGACDILSILTNIFLGDLESTSVKGFVYCLRIRLEVAVLGQMVDYVRKRRNPTSSSQGVATLEEKGQQQQEEEGGEHDVKCEKARPGVRFQVEDKPEGTPGTRKPAGDSFAMMTLTQVLMDDDDNSMHEGPDAGDMDEEKAGTILVEMEEESQDEGSSDGMDRTAACTTASEDSSSDKGDFVV